jgi:RND family efflux transporter MFP subunit
LQAGLFCAGLALGCGQESQQAEKAPPAPVKAVEAKRQPMAQWTDLLGTTQPLPGHAAQVSAVVGGLVQSILTDGKAPALAEGERVTAGHVIVQLDDRVARANRAKAEAGQQELVQQKKQADNAVVQAQRDLQNILKLRSDLQSPAALAQARLAIENAESKAREAADRQKAGQAALRELDEQLDFYKLRAPISGRLGRVHAQPGQTLAPGATVADIIDLDEIDVLCFAPPHLATRLAVGQPAELVNGDGHAAGDARAPVGKVVFVAVQAQADTGNFAVKVRFPNRSWRGLRANTVVHLRVETREPRTLLTIKEAALMEDQQPPAVIVIEDIETKKNDEGKDEKTGKARKLQAVIGIRDRHEQLVELRGLMDPEKKKEVAIEKDMLFVVEGGHGLHDGDAVLLEEEEHEEHE